MNQLEKKEIDEILKITRKLLKIPSIINHEKTFLDFLNKNIKKFGYKTTLKKDYLIVKSPNNKKRKENYLFSVHIDRHGLILNKENKLEYIAYNIKKKLKLKFKRDTPEFFLSCAQRHTNDIIYSIKNNKLLKKYKITRYDLDWKNKEVFFETEKDLRAKPNDIFMLNPELKIKKDYFFGQIDNVISVAVLFYLLKKKEFIGEIIFTTKEEIGLSYKNVLDYFNRTNSNKTKIKLITLDTSPYENFKNKKNGFLVLREGDENGNFDFNLLKKIKTKMKELEIPSNLKSSNNGMTELGRISTESKGKLNGITLQIPTKNYHTTYETTTKESLKSYLRIIRDLSKDN